MTNEQLWALAGIVGVYVLLAVLLVIQSYRLAKRQLQLETLKDANLEPALALMAEENIRMRLAFKDIHLKAQETELFTRLSLEMGMPLPEGDPDDTIPVHDA